MTTQKTNKVTAKFGGEDLTFELARSTLQTFEFVIGEPAQNLLERIGTRYVTVKDVRSVLEYAAPEGYGRSLPDRHDAITLQMWKIRSELAGPSDTFVAQVLVDNPPMKYAVLARGILTAALHGLPEDAAHFDEDEELAIVDG